MLSQLLTLSELLLLLSVAAIYIIQCPFNKVEESFNTQAIHDIVNILPNRIPLFQHHRTDVSSLAQNESAQEIPFRSQLPWDHVQFPGIVPRTFIGALILGLPLKLVKTTISHIFIRKDDHGQEEPDFIFQFVLQLGARFALSSLVVVSLGVLTRSIHRRYGITYRIFFLILTVSQFHYMFYAGRFIPNTYAAILANLIFSSWICRRYSQAIIYVAICAVIFRFDTALFFGILLLDAIFIRRLFSLSKMFQVGIPIGLMSMTATFIVDSTFWGRAIWPELESLYFNVWLNRSHEWGMQPYFWYIYSCIPRMMMFSTPLLFLAEHKFTREYFIPVIAFIFTYSILPHKELRFILYVNPLLNLCAASGLANIKYQIDRTINSVSTLRTKSFPAPRNQKKTRKSEASQELPGGNYFSTLLFTILILLMLVANLFCCFIMTRVSSYNYPGGKAALSVGVTRELVDKAQESVRRFKSLSINSGTDVSVYVDNLAAQSGVSRFLHADGVYYSKTAKLDASTFKWPYKLIYLILEPKETNILKSFCPLVKNLRDQNEIRNCTLPNQSKMTCSIIETVNALESVNMGAFIRKAYMLSSISAINDLLDDKTFIKTRVVLYIIRCINQIRGV